MRTLLKVIGGIAFGLILLGALFDGWFPEGSTEASANKRPNPSSVVPRVGDVSDPRFHGPGHPMYGKNYYQAANEILNEMQQAGYDEEQIKMVFLAMEATKCRACNGHGWRGRYRCETCKGDGMLEN